MKYTKTIEVEAIQFPTYEFNGLQNLKTTFEGVQVRHNGNEHFIMFPLGNGQSVKVLEGQWIVTDETGVSVWSDEDFKENFSEIKAPKIKAEPKEVKPKAPTKTKEKLEPPADATIEAAK